MDDLYRLIYRKEKVREQELPAESCPLALLTVVYADVLQDRLS